MLDTTTLAKKIHMRSKPELVWLPEALVFLWGESKLAGARSSIFGVILYGYEFAFLFPRSEAFIEAYESRFRGS